MEKTINISNIISWVFATLLVIVGILNIVLVHPIPGAVYLILSLLYFPPTYTWLTEKYDFSIPVLIRIALAIVLTMFTLGVSDLGDIIDKL
ncbi:hypothetical protein [Rufibacter roseus]|uniref:DUF1616 domain-containing protein n=1 Tax=Rufibacter roseus TaxID=1567108 RepID=A0ABW2DMP2_9BACT|nr:hypothetical protein [Rufibacter roseus]